jgi:hypothetical protein
MSRVIYRTVDGLEVHLASVRVGDEGVEVAVELTDSPTTRERIERWQALVARWAEALAKASRTADEPPPGPALFLTT